MLHFYEYFENTLNAKKFEFKNYFTQDGAASQL